MPVKWHCPIILSNTRASFFSENGQTSLVTCLMTNVVKRMTCPTVPRGLHLPWVGPVHPSPASEFRTPGLPLRAVTAAEDHPSWTDAGCCRGLTAGALHPASPTQGSAVRAPHQGASGGLRGVPSSLSSHTSFFSLLMLPVFPGGCEDKGVSSEGYCSGKSLSSLSIQSTILLDEHPSSLGCSWVRCLI